MIEKINFGEIIINDQVFLYVAIALVLFAVYGVVKLIQLIKKIKRQKAKLHDLVKNYEEFLHQRGEK